MTQLGTGSVAPGTGGLDEFVHTPARLAILSLLAPADWVAFSFLRETIATSDSALSKQLRALEEAGYVESFKDRSARRSTSVRLTAHGRSAFETYLDALEQLVARARGAG
ncbi:transcriptional regulator [uncultured Friedmanniella sp.]|uniref:transcriptional regulator n=1 Tax=uncultured Friedmanniella sp. TaxID=335381 RepID=UPI0035CA65DC